MRLILYTCHSLRLRAEVHSLFHFLLQHLLTGPHFINQPRLISYIPITVDRFDADLIHSVLLLVLVLLFGIPNILLTLYRFIYTIYIVVIVIVRDITVLMQIYSHLLFVVDAHYRSHR